MRAPVVVEFAGMPGVGKTTILRGVCASLRDRGFEVEIVEEAATHNPMVDLKSDWRYTLWNVGWNSMHLSYHLSSKSLNYVAIDRGFFDLHCWLRYFRSLNAFSSAEDFVRISRYCQSEVWAGGGHFVFLLRATYRDVLARRGGKTGRIVNSEVWDRLALEYDSSAYREAFPSAFIQELDVSDGQADAVTALILDALPSTFPL